MNIYTSGQFFKNKGILFLLFILLYTSIVGVTVSIAEETDSTSRGSTGALVKQSLIGAQVFNNIPYWSESSAELARGNSAFSFDPAMSLFKAPNIAATGSIIFSNLAGTDTRVATISSSGEVDALANGSDGDVLSLVSGVPTWTAISGGTGDVNHVNTSYVGITSGPSGNGSDDGLGNNIFIGDVAGAGATNVTSSNFFGTGAGAAATSAGNSNFLGALAGNAAVYASNSNFLGYYAGWQATNANNSNFLGFHAGDTSTNALYSNFLGNYAGAQSSNAQHSNFLGFIAGKDATNAQYSNFLGNSAGYGATDASFSNLFGFQAGKSFTSNKIGTNNIIIGTNVSLPDAATNAVNIGGVLFAKGTYSVISSNPLTTPVSGGKIGIGVVNPSYTLQVGNTSLSGIVARFQNSAGTCDINPTTASLTCSSDETLKKNITSLNDSILEKVLLLRPVTYSWNSEANAGSPHVGFIAQEVESVFPDVVTTDATTGLKSLAYTNLIPYTVKAIQEMQIKIASLEVVKGPSFTDTVQTFLKEVSEGVVRTKKLCVEDVCIDKAQLQDMLTYMKEHTAEGSTVSSGDTVKSTDAKPVSTPIATDSSTEHVTQ